MKHLFVYFMLTWIFFLKKNVILELFTISYLSQKNTSPSETKIYIFQGYMKHQARQLFTMIAELEVRFFLSFFVANFKYSIPTFQELPNLEELWYPWRLLCHKNTWIKAQ